MVSCSNFYLNPWTSLKIVFQTSHIFGVCCLFLIYKLLDYQVGKFQESESFGFLSRKLFDFFCFLVIIVKKIFPFYLYGDLGGA